MSTLKTIILIAACALPSWTLAAKWIYSSDENPLTDKTSITMATIHTSDMSAKIIIVDSISGVEVTLPLGFIEPHCKDHCSLLIRADKSAPVVFKASFHPGLLGGNFSLNNPSEFVKYINFAREIIVGIEDRGSRKEQWIPIATFKVDGPPLRLRSLRN